MHPLQPYEGPRGVAYLFALVAAIGPPTIAMFLLEPALLVSLDWPRVFLVCAACGATSISLCLVGAVIALMPAEDKLNARTRAKALRAALTMAFAVAFVVEVGALALSTKHGSAFAAYVRWSLQMSIAGAAFVILVSWWTDRAERAIKSRGGSAAADKVDPPPQS